MRVNIDGTKIKTSGKTDEERLDRTARGLDLMMWRLMAAEERNECVLRSDAVAWIFRRDRVYNKYKKNIFNLC